jgi:DNA repair exonuclease SbcCD ATPase subunit
MGIAVSGGMLDDVKVAFSPHQNCIIGKNYAGKSALLDCLRFALNAIPIDEDLHDKFAKRLLAFVGEGGEVRVYLNQCGTTYGISRVFSLTQIGRGVNSKKHIEGEPEIYSVLMNEFRHESDLKIENIFSAEVYPQGEVVKIKDNANQQIKLVNSLARIDTKLQELTQQELDGELTILGMLEQNSKEIISEIEHQCNLEEEVQGLDQLEKNCYQLIYLKIVKFRLVRLHLLKAKRNLISR